MIPFLRAYMGKGKQFRTPKRMWEDLWRLKRGEMNHVLGQRCSTRISNFKGPKYQKGMIVIATAPGVPAAGGSSVGMQNITNAVSSVAPTPSRQHYAWDSDGSVEYDDDCTTIASIVYVELTTGTDDSNDHTNDWWPDQPDVNEGLNWDIRYTSHTQGGAGGTFHNFKTTAGTDRVEDTWYLLDTVSNDHADAAVAGSMGFNRANGTAKTPSTGTATLDTTIEIRATGSGSAVDSSVLDLQVQGT
jgi:hypothetical protein